MFVSLESKGNIKIITKQILFIVLQTILVIIKIIFTLHYKIINMVGIYKITSPENKVYIGESRSLIKRLKTYNRLSCKKQIKLYNSFIKYGLNNHKFEILVFLDDDISDIDLNMLERKYYDIYIKKYELLNIKIPGNIGNTHHSQETILKISTAKKKHFSVTQFTKDRKFVKYWESFHIASKELNINSKYIKDVTNGISSSTGGFIFVKGYLEKIPEINKKRFKRNRRLGIRQKMPVYQYDHRKLVKEWHSASIAAEKLGLNPKCISAVINGITKQHGGFQWSRVKL